MRHSAPLRSRPFAWRSTRRRRRCTQQPVRVHAVDITHEWRMDRITDQFPRPLRQRPSNVWWNGETHVLELAYPASAILRRDDQTRPVGTVAASAMPERALGNGERARGHRKLHRVRAMAGIMILVQRRSGVEVRRLRRTLDSPFIPQMASGNHFRAAVRLGGIVDRPERADTERRPRARQPRAAIVSMPGLYRLAWMQVDGEEGRQEATRPKLGFDEGKYERMDDEFGEQRRLCKQRIDAIGLQSLEIVTALQVAIEMRRERGADRRDLFGRQHALEDHEAAAVEFVPPVLQGTALEPRRSLRMGAGGCRLCHSQILPQILPKCLPIRPASE